MGCAKILACQAMCYNNPPPVPEGGADAAGGDAGSPSDNCANNCTVMAGLSTTSTTIYQVQDNCANDGMAAMACATACMCP
jgi:hypothetical protein